MGVEDINLTDGMGDKFWDSFVIFEAWHGTSCENAKKIKKTGQWIESSPEREWLGVGVYFMEGSKAWACIWARKGKHKFQDACAIRCFLTAKRKEVLDLFNDHWFRMFQRFREKLMKPEVGSIQDGIVIDYICKRFREEEGIDIKIVRASVRLHKNQKEVEPISPGSKLVKSQVQLCVKDSKIIEIDKIEECQRGD